MDTRDHESPEEVPREAELRRGRFLAVLAHELRNPLAPIRNAVEMLRLTSPENEQVLRCGDLIDRQVSRLSALLEDLLDVSRLALGGLELRVGRADLREVLEQAVQSTAPLMADRRHTLSVTLPPGEVPLAADAPRLVRLFTILLDNAAKYTDEGGQIAVTCRAEAQALVISVRDSGVGIDPALLSQVFEPFTGSAPHDPRTGLGLGLPLARGIAAMHGGTLEARSEGPGLGSEFVVQLPLPALHSDDGRAAAVAGKQDGPPIHWRIVLADDLRLNADALSDLIRLQGHEVVTVYDGHSAIAATASLRPDVVILDLGMPGIDGYEACRRIRAEAWGQEALIIALTGWGQQDVPERTRAAGFTHHMLKPVDHEALLAALSRFRRTPDATPLD